MRYNSEFLKATFYFSELLLSKIEVFEFSLNYLTEVTCPKVGPGLRPRSPDPLRPVPLPRAPNC